MCPAVLKMFQNPFVVVFSAKSVYNSTAIKAMVAIKPKDINQ